MEMDIETVLKKWKKGVLPQNINEIDKILREIQKKKAEVETTIQTVGKEEDDDVEMHSKQEEKYEKDVDREEEEDDEDEDDEDDKKQKIKKEINMAMENILILGSLFFN